MNRIFQWTGATILVLILMTGCKDLDKISMTGVSDFEFKGMQNNEVSFSARVGVSNPSNVTFRVTEVNLKTIVDGNFIGTLTSQDKIRVPARSDSAYMMNFTLGMANMLTGASQLYTLARKKKVQVQMQGYIKAHTWLTTKKKEINENRTLDVPAFNR
jgi:LEA14-like dessication related protein